LTIDQRFHLRQPHGIMMLLWSPDCLISNQSLLVLFYLILNEKAGHLLELLLTIYVIKLASDRLSFVLVLVFL